MAGKSHRGKSCRPRASKPGAGRESRRGKPQTTNAARVAMPYDLSDDELSRYLRNEHWIRDAKDFEVEGFKAAYDIQALLAKFGMRGPNQSPIVIGRIRLRSESPAVPTWFPLFNTDCRGIPGDCGNQVCPRAIPGFPQPWLKNIKPRYAELKLIDRGESLLWIGRGKGPQHACTFPDDPKCDPCTACRAIINTSTHADDRFVTVRDVKSIVKLSIPALSRWAKQWGDPDEPSSGNRGRRWRLSRLKPILKRQFPHLAQRIDDWLGP
jgi:hypothetical protein